MHLKEKKKHCNHRYDCDCHKKRKAQRFDETPAPSTLEEHFESFTGAVGEVAEEFLGLGKKARQKRQERRLVKAQALVSAAAPSPAPEETPVFTPAAPPSRLVKIASGLDKLTSAPLKNQAENQALQVNQLQSMVKPSAPAVSPAETPSASGTEGGGEQLYKTLPDTEAPAQTPEQAAAPEQTSKGIEAPVTEAPAPASASTKKTGLIVIAVVVIAVVVYFQMKKK